MSERFEFVALRSVEVDRPVPFGTEPVEERNDPDYPIRITEGRPGEVRMTFLYEGAPTVEGFVEAVRAMFRSDTTGEPR